jgi:hypothetical protein
LLQARTDKETKEEYRRLYLHGGPRWIAKDRHDTFNRFLDKPDIAEMNEAVSARQGSDRVVTPIKKKKVKASG